MIPILYEKDETAFTSNGLGRLRDCISCVVTEERNGIYECDFEYPIDGVNYDRIQCGRIIAVEHDESNDVQPFDIVGYSRPINGVVTFHAVHISYRQTALTVSGTNINSLADAFTLLGNAEPSNPFNYWTDKDSTGYMASGDGVPHSVRSILGGMEGSILDAYGGEYEWDTWTVKLWASRGSLKNFTIRYGVNLTDYSEDTDYTDTYTSVVPYWVGQDADGNALTIIGDRQESGYPPFNGTERCIPIDVTDKFDSEGGQPTKAQVEAEGLAYIQQNQPFLPAQTIKVDFVRISDSPEYAQFKSLQTCKLCDSVNVMFPRYNVEGTFKIVKTEYDVLNERYLTLELGTLSISLATALGINSSGSYYVSVGGGGGSVDSTPIPTSGKVSEFDSSAHMNSTDMTSQEVEDFVDSLNVGGTGGIDYIVEQGTSGDWIYRKWNSGFAECWWQKGISVSGSSVNLSNYIDFPFTFIAPPIITNGLRAGGIDAYRFHTETTTTTQVRLVLINTYSGTVTMTPQMYVVGKWK